MAFLNPERLKRGIRRRVIYYFYKTEIFLILFFDLFPKLKRFKMMIYFLLQNFFARFLNFIAEGIFVNPSFYKDKTKDTLIPLNYVKKYNFDHYKYRKDFLLNRVREQKINLRSIYPSSNDIIKLQKQEKGPQIFLGVANLNSLDILSNLNPELAIFCDINYSQLIFLDFLIELIKRSKNRVEFLSILFGKSPEGIAEILSRVNRKIYDLDQIEDLFWKIKNTNTQPLNNLHAAFLNYNLVKSPENSEKIIGIQHHQLGKSVFGNIKMIFSFVKDKDGASGDFCPFYKKGGFLESEEQFQSLKKILKNSPIILHQGPVNQELLQSIFLRYRYYFIYIWLSNLLNFWFIHKVKEWPEIIDSIIYYKYIAKNFCGIKVLEDERRRFFKKEKINITPHYDAFRIISKYIAGSNNAEVVIDIDSQEPSTLRECEILNWQKFLITNKKYNCCLLHILLGHGLDEQNFQKVILKAKNSSKITIILEHNKDSLDFENKNNFLYSVEDLKNLAGIPNIIEYSLGFKDNQRNIIFIYYNN